MENRKWYRVTFFFLVVLGFVVCQYYLLSSSGALEMVLPFESIVTLGIILAVATALTAVAFYYNKARIKILNSLLGDKYKKLKAEVSDYSLLSDRNVKRQTFELKAIMDEVLKLEKGEKIYIANQRFQDLPQAGDQVIIKTDNGKRSVGSVQYIDMDRKVIEVEKLKS